MSGRLAGLDSWLERQREERVATVTVGYTDVLKFNYATGQTEPEYVDRVAAKALGYSDLVAAPGFTTALALQLHYLHPTADLGADGVPRLSMPPVPVSKMVAGEVEDDFGAPICAGHEVTVTERVTEYELKRGTNGPIIAYSFDRRFLHGGVEIAKQRYTRLIVVDDRSVYA